MNRIIKILIIIFLIMFPKISDSQINSNIFNDLGYSHVYSFYGNTGLILDYKIKKFDFETGTNFLYASEVENSLNNLYFGINYNSIIKKQEVVFKTAFLHTFVSNEIYENNYIVTANQKFKHFEYILGFNNRFYNFTPKIKDEISFENQGFKIYEPFNLMYLIKYQFFEKENKFNFSISVTDFDYFYIQQETNPMLYLETCYNINNKLNIYSQLWSKKSGVIHATANFYGYFLRFGLKWKITN